MLARAESIPNLRAVSLSAVNPMSGRDQTVGASIPGFTPATDRDLTIHLNHVSPGYFDAFHIRLLAGRKFDERDRENAPRAAILNETAARFYFPGNSAVGRKIVFPRRNSAPAFDIVGVVADSKHANCANRPNAWLTSPSGRQS